MVEVERHRLEVRRPLLVEVVGEECHRRLLVEVEEEARLVDPNLVVRLDRLRVPLPVEAVHHLPAADSAERLPILARREAQQRRDQARDIVLLD